MFRIQQNVPEVYPHKSRDFQLFCRAYDSLFNGVKYSIDSTTHTSNTMECNNTLLSLLANKLGLFTNLNLPDIELRYVLCAFPYLIRYKGSYTAIEYTVHVFQRMARLNNLSYTIDVDDEKKQISLSFNRDITNDALLYELLSYIIPTGYTCTYVVFSNDTNITRIVNSHTISFEKFNPVEMAKIYYSTDNTQPIDEINKVGSSVVSTYKAPMEDNDEQQ